jgi:hypothetical protein
VAATTNRPTSSLVSRLSAACPDHGQREQDVTGLGQRAAVPAEVPRGQLHQHRLLRRRAQRRQVDAAGENAVLHVVHGVGDVVGPVHDLRLEAAPALGRAVADPGEQLRVAGVGAVLAVARSAHPGVLAGRVEAGAGEVEATPADLGFEPGEDAQRLGIALEPALDAVRGPELVECALAVVPERRVADVVGEPGGVDDVRVAAEVLGDAAADLGHLERVRQPGSRRAADLRALPGAHHLRLAREAAQRGGVQHPRAVAGERAAPFRASGGLRRLRDLTLAVVVGVRHPSPVVSVSTEEWVSR